MVPPFKKAREPRAVIGKLNIFQRTVHLWNGMHAYNAVHVVRIDRPLDESRLREVIHDELMRLGLTGLVLDKRKGTFEYQGGPPQIDLKLIQGGATSREILRDEVQFQINTSFVDNGAVNPFRFFLIREEKGFYFGLVYFHVVAGAESIILLLKHLVETYLGQLTLGFSIPLDLYPGGYGRLTPHYFSLLLRSILHFPLLLAELRKSSRPRHRDDRNQRNDVVLFSLTPDQLRKLQERGKRWEVTLNDLFLALLLKALNPLASRRLRGKRRGQISVGSIVNIRKDLGIDSLRTFGLFLGSFLVSLGVREGCSVEDLAKEVRQRTLRVKRERLYLGTPFELWMGRFAMSLLASDRRHTFYVKNYPLWGGISNVNLDLLWETKGERGRIDYLRAVSTGPITPLVLSVTTVGDLVNVGLTFRQTVFSPGEIDQFVSEFRDAIVQL